MISKEQFTRLSQIFPFLQNKISPLSYEFQSKAFFMRIPAGKDVFVEGDSADTIALLISGVVRVYKIGETGREITLYRFGQGQSCILTANAILNNKSFPAIATVEQDAEAIIIPAADFRDWVNRYDLWREFVFGLLSDRLVTIMAVVDEVVFQRMDSRVATWILKRVLLKNSLQVTHQEIASDLGSSREVISRILEDFSKSGLISQGRGSIEVLDKKGLSNRAEL